MVKNIAILGSTGSIGRQALDVVDCFPGELRVKGLAADSNYILMERQVRKYRPDKVALRNTEAAEKLREKISDLPLKVYSGPEGVLEVAANTDAEIVLVAIVGFDGLEPTLAAIKAGKKIARANKEALVVGGELLTKEAKKRRIPLYPVDSEHSAIFQCLQGLKKEEVKRIILTASGGPFYGWQYAELQKVTPEKALKHPNWKMGRKITIDSATLMNKGFEVLEARWLFELPLEKIDVLIHPQSIIHSLVECIDCSVLAQLGLPDMTLPIQYALFYPRRRSNLMESLELERIGTLSFYPPDRKNFPCLDLAYKAGRKGGTMPACLNAANEVCVELFLEGKISFLEIPTLISRVMNKHENEIIESPTLGELIRVNNWAREEVLKLFENKEGE